MGMSKLIPLLFLFAIGCRLTMKNTIQVPYGECSKENAEKSHFIDMIQKEINQVMI